MSLNKKRLWRGMMVFLGGPILKELRRGVLIQWQLGHQIIPCRQRGPTSSRTPLLTEYYLKPKKASRPILCWDQNQYELKKETKCGQMFRTVIQQKIFEEIILALDTKIAPQRAINFENIKE